MCLSKTLPEENENKKDPVLYEKCKKKK